MPVLVNAQTGNAENFPDQQSAAAAVQAGTHGIPLVDPSGQPVTAGSDEEAQGLLSQGYSQPTPAQLQQGLNYAQYSTLPQEAATVAEGALSTLPLGIGTAAERAAGVSSQGINERAEINPVLHGAGQIAGLGAQAILAPELGLTGAMGAAGETAAEGAEALGLGKVGSAATKLAVENAIFSANDEASKLVSGDPTQTAETAMANIGLGALVGGALGTVTEGAISPLWEATKKSDLSKALGSIVDKVNGVSDGIVDPTVDSAAKTAGVDLTPEMRYALGTPEGAQSFQDLVQSETKSGIDLKNQRDEFLGNLRNSVIDALGTTPDELDGLTEYSDHSAGQDIQQSLINELKAKQNPLAQQFEDLKSQYEQVPVSNAKKAAIANELNSFAQEKGYHITPGDAQMGLVNKVISSLPNVETAADLNKVISNSLNLSPTSDGSLLNAASGIRQILRSSVDDSIVKAATDIDPSLADQYQSARAAYAEQARDREYLADVLHPGKAVGPDMFAQKVSEMEPEAVLKRITATNRADFSDFLSQKFPETYQKVLGAQKADILWRANQAAKEGTPISLKKLYSLLDGMSPELRNRIFSPEAQAKIAGARKLESLIPAVKNPSGTAGVVNKLMGKLPGGIGGMLGWLAGGPGVGHLFGWMEGKVAGSVAGSWATQTLPDALKLMTMKILGSDGPVDVNAFVRGASFLSHAIKSDNLMTKGAKIVFDGASKEFPKAFMSSPAELRDEREKLDNAVEVASRDPSGLMNIGGEMGSYLPGHQAAMAAASARAVSYLRSIKPQENKMGPFGHDRRPSSVEQSRYDRALDLANDPRRAFASIQDGTLSASDVKHLNSMYPGFVKTAQSKLMNAAIEHTAGGSEISYPTKIALSKFLGQPLDASLTPQSIQMLQGPKSPPAQAPAQAPKQHKVPLNALKDFSSAFQTPSQTREAAKAAS